MFFVFVYCFCVVVFCAVFMMVIRLFLQCVYIVFRWFLNCLLLGSYWLEIALILWFYIGVCVAFIWFLVAFHGFFPHCVILDFADEDGRWLCYIYIYSGGGDCFSSQNPNDSP